MDLNKNNSLFNICKKSYFCLPIKKLFQRVFDLKVSKQDQTIFAEGHLLYIQ